MPNTFHLSILTPERTFFEGEAESLTVQAVDGELGVMAGHAPEAISLVEGTLRLTADGQSRWAAASAGFATILPDSVFVILQTVEWPEEIDVRRAERSRMEAEERLRQQKSLQEYHLARSKLARAMVRLRVTGQSRINNE